MWRNAGQTYTTTGWVCTRRRLHRVMIRTGRRRGGTTAVRRRSDTGRSATRAQTTTTLASGSRRTAGRTLRAAPSTASLARRKQVIAEFHYTCPTGPDRTLTDFLRPAFPRNSVGSVRVSDNDRAGPCGSARVRVVEFSLYKLFIGFWRPRKAGLNKHAVNHAYTKYTKSHHWK